MRRLDLHSFLLTGIGLRLVIFALTSIATAAPTAALPVALTPAAVQFSE
jgi:hypothetical protein